MHESFLDADDEDEVGNLAIDREVILQGAVAYDVALAADTKCVAFAWDQEEQSHLRIRKQVLKRIQAMVSGPIRDCQGFVVEDSDEAWRITLGRQIHPPICASGGNDHEGAGGNEPAADVVDVIDYLV